MCACHTRFGIAKQANKQLSAMRKCRGIASPYGRKFRLLLNCLRHAVATNNTAEGLSLRTIYIGKRACQILSPGNARGCRDKRMFLCGVPTNLAAFSRVFDAAKDQFGDLSTSPETATKIFAFRPEIYLAIIAANGIVAAYSSAYPLRKEWASAFIAGDIAEPDLTPDMLLSRKDSLDGTTVGVGHILVCNGYDPFTKSVLLASLFSWRAQQLQSLSVRRMTAIMTPITKHGARLVRYVGAKRLGTDTDMNGYGIYGRDISPGFLYRMTSSMDRFIGNSIVKMTLDFQPSLLPSFASSNQGRSLPNLEAV
jgi:hypothetical protein